MTVISGQVGAPSTTSISDGTTSTSMLQGKQAEAIYAKLHGDSYTQAYRGNVYWASAAVTGLVTTIFSNTTYVGLLLWNQSTTKNLVPIRAFQSRILAATTVCGFGSCFVNGGSALGTPISAFTAITATRGAANTPAATGQGSSVALVGGGATLGTAFAWGLSNGLAAGTETTAIVEQTYVQDFQGSVIIPPGTCMAVMAATAAQGGTWVPSIVWEEVPV